jgi:hypothetical protein
MVGRAVAPQPTRIQIPDLILWCLIKAEYFSVGQWDMLSASSIFAHMQYVFKEKCRKICICEFYTTEYITEKKSMQVDNG